MKMSRKSLFSITFYFSTIIWKVKPFYLGTLQHTQKNALLQDDVKFRMIKKSYSDEINLEDRLTTERNYGKKDLLKNFELTGPFDLKLITSEQENDLSKYWSFLTYKLGLLGMLFLIYPLVQNASSNILRFSLLWTDENFRAVNATLSGAFLPTISLLFATLSSFTASYLVNIQGTLKCDINRELAAAVKVTQRVITLDLPQKTKCEIFENLWSYMTTVSEKSKQDEMHSMLYEDPLLSVLRILDKEVQSAGVERVLGDLEQVLAMRQDRLTAEGETLPTILTTLLRFLGVCIGLGFLALCDNPEILNNGATDFEIRCFFALLFSGLILTFDFLQDLNDPFTGIFKISPRVLTNVNLLQMRNLIYEEMGKEWVDKTEEQYEETFVTIQKIVEQTRNVKL